MVIACAEAAQATYLVAKNKDLLSLKQYQGIPIVTPEAFMQLLREQSTTTKQNYLCQLQNTALLTKKTDGQWTLCEKLRRNREKIPCRRRNSPKNANGLCAMEPDAPGSKASPRKT